MMSLFCWSQQFHTVTAYFSWNQVWWNQKVLSAYTLFYINTSNFELRLGGAYLIFDPIFRNDCPTLPVQIHIISTIFLYKNCFQNNNILEHSSQNWPKSQPGGSSKDDVYIKNVFFPEHDVWLTHLITFLLTSALFQHFFIEIWENDVMWSDFHQTCRKCFFPWYIGCVQIWNNLHFLNESYEN